MGIGFALAVITLVLWLLFKSRRATPPQVRPQHHRAIRDVPQHDRVLDNERFGDVTGSAGRTCLSCAPHAM